MNDITLPFAFEFVASKKENGVYLIQLEVTFRTVDVFLSLDTPPSSHWTLEELGSTDTRLTRSKPNCFMSWKATGKSNVTSDAALAEKLSFIFTVSETGGHAFVNPVARSMAEMLDAHQSNIDMNVVESNDALKALIEKRKQQ